MKREDDYWMFAPVGMTGLSGLSGLIPSAPIPFPPSQIAGIILGMEPFSATDGGAGLNYSFSDDTAFFPCNDADLLKASFNIHDSTYWGDGASGMQFFSGGHANGKGNFAYGSGATHFSYTKPTAFIGNVAPTDLTFGCVVKMLTVSGPGSALPIETNSIGGAAATVSGIQGCGIQWVNGVGNPTANNIITDTNVHDVIVIIQNWNINIYVDGVNVLSTISPSPLPPVINGPLLGGTNANGDSNSNVYSWFLADSALDFASFRNMLVAYKP